MFSDRMKHTVFMYTSEGEFIRTIGREGEGPGEFNLPGTLAFYSDGRLLIRDSDGISIFDSSYTFQDQMTWPFLPPFSISALDSGGFIGQIMNPREGEDRILWASTLTRWDGDEDPSVEYFSIEFDWIIEEVSDRSRHRENTIYSSATRDGRVFYSRSSIDDFEIHGCEPDGSPFLHIVDENFHRVRKTGEDLQAEMNELESMFIRARGSAPDEIPVKLDPYRRIIRDMFTDGEERLWVRLGSYPGILFRVYDFSGEILFHAEVEYSGHPSDLNTWEITGDEHGFLGHNRSPEDYQRVYMLTLVENE